MRRKGSEASIHSLSFSEIQAMRFIDSQVLRFVGENAFLGGKDFCFHYVLMKKFSGHDKMWGDTKKFGICPRMPPVATGLFDLRKLMPRYRTTLIEVELLK